MEDERLTKRMVPGWKEANNSKAKRRRMTNPNYWWRICKNAGINPYDLNSLASSRDNWRALVNRRMESIQRWERGMEESRNQRRERESYKCDTCRDEFEENAALVQHNRLMHVRTERIFGCSKCDVKFK